jgi:hypothetical protein
MGTKERRTFTEKFNREAVRPVFRPPLTLQRLRVD